MALVEQEPIVTSLDTRALLNALTALKRGDFSVRLPVEWTGMSGKVGDQFNEVVDSTGIGVDIGLAAGECRAFDLATVDVIGVEGVARPAVGVVADPAGARSPARARFKERSIEHVGFGRGC